MADEGTLVKWFVQQKIQWLTGNPNESAARATLAQLRRGIGKAPGSIPELWSMTLEGLPESLLSKNGEPTYGEQAVHTALTLFALYQQGKELKSQCVSKEGVSLGAAVRRLIQSDEDEQRIKRRFDAAITADSMEEFSHHLRGLIQLMKADGVALDYPMLAEDIYRFQFAGRRDAVRLRWGQDYYRIHQDATETEQTGKEENQNE